MFVYSIWSVFFFYFLRDCLPTDPLPANESKQNKSSFIFLKIHVKLCKIHEILVLLLLICGVIPEDQNDVK